MNNPANQVTVLVVEDELPIRRFLKASLPEEKYKVVEASSGKEAIQMVASFNPDLVLVDLGLPDLDGLEVIKRIREWSQVPIIVISARGQENDKILALDSGANDYLIKPFGVGELLARIRVSLRLSPRTSTEQSSLEFGDIKIDFSARQVFRSGREIHLTPHEFQLLSLMARNAGKVLTHRNILTEVWGQAYASQLQYLRVFMGQLRRKLEAEPARPKHLTTEPGVGYRLRIDS